MFGILKSVFGMGEGRGGSDKKNLFSLAGELEYLLLSENICMGYSNVVDTASRLRNVLRGPGLRLTRAEKIHILKLINKAKVKALFGGTPDCYRSFVSLDSISNDMLTFL
jgi:hypothetical protein